MLGNSGQVSIYTPSIADSCASKVLGMNGSLTGYIKTGNAYNKDYFQKRKSSTNNESKITKSEKEKQTLKKVLVAGLTALGVGILGIKCKKGISSLLESGKKLFKIPTTTGTTEKAKKILSRFV